MIIDRVIRYIVHVNSLLLNRQSSPDPFILSAVLRNLSHHAIRWILPDNIVPDCQLKRRMQQGMDSIERIILKSALIQQVIVELQDIRILDVFDLL